jgi:transposase
MKAYSQDLRDRVILTYESGEHNKSKISRIFKVGYDAVCEWIDRYKKTGDYRSKQGVNYGRVAKYNDKQAILDFLEKSPDANGIQIRDELIPEMHINTFYDTLKCLKITYKKAKIQTKV